MFNPGGYTEFFTDPKKKTALYLCAFFVLITAVKLLLVVFSNPMVGYANNYDFVRQSACVGIWQYKEGLNKQQQSMDLVSPILVFDGDKAIGQCRFSSDNLFPYLVSLNIETGTQLLFSDISLLRATCSLLLVVILILAASNSLRIALAVTSFLILSDISVMSYLNTLYLEYSVVTSAFLALAFASLLAGQNTRPVLVLVGGVLSMLWLALVKAQYLYFAVGLLATAAILTIQTCRARVVPVLCFLLALALLIAHHFRTDESAIADRVAKINKIDTFLYTVLPAATNLSGALKHLNLPLHCMNTTGESAFDIADIESFCPELATLSRRQLPGLWLLAPETFITPMWNGLKLTQPVYAKRLINTQQAITKSEALYRFLEVSSASYWWAMMPVRIYNGISVALMLSGLAVTTRLLARMDADEDNSLAMLYGLGGSWAFYSLFSSVFGDGYAELNRHAPGFKSALTLQLVALAVLIFGGSRRKPNDNETESTESAVSELELKSSRQRGVS